MKYIVFICCLVSVCFATVSGAGNATEEVCGALPGNETCCNTTGCMLFSCLSNTTDAKNLIDCHLATWEAGDKCKENTTKPICPAAPTVPPTTTNDSTAAPTTKAPSTAASTTAKTPEDNCTDAKDKDSCCKKDGCIFTNCTSTDEEVTNPVEVCVKDETTVCKPDTNKNQCETPVTTPTPVVVDECEQYKTDTDCCDQQTDKNCTYISCTGTDTKAHTGCHVKTFNKTAFCTDEPMEQCTSTPAPITKPSGDVTSQAPPTNGTTQSPTDANAHTGSKDSGQKFDGASFIGGIVLCAGLVAIAIFAFKCYKSKTERNYQTL